MKKNSRVALMVMALALAFGMSAASFAQQIAGGYGDASVTDPEVIAAARFAVSRQSRTSGTRISLVSIERAEVQVVAGLNYRMTLRVTMAGEPRTAMTVVYKDLRRRYALTSWTIEGGSTSNATTIEQLVESLGEAYSSKTLAKLDADHPYVGSVRVVIENSLAEDNAKDRFVVGSFKTLAKADEWLKKRERGDDGPSRQLKPLKRCARGVCTYDFEGGIGHNQLYLKKVTYGIRRGKPYLKTIYLLDGD